MVSANQMLTSVSQPTVRAVATTQGVRITTRIGTPSSGRVRRSHRQSRTTHEKAIADRAAIMGVMGPLVRIPAPMAHQNAMGQSHPARPLRGSSSPPLLSPRPTPRIIIRAAIAPVVVKSNNWSARAWWASQTTMGLMPSRAAPSQPARAWPMAMPSRQVMRQAAMALRTDGTR
jgi:hypothetical protein